MSAGFAEKSGHVLKAVWRFLRIFTLNMVRRTVILGRYTLICWQQQRLRRAWRLLGKRIQQYQAIAVLKEKIRTACAAEVPPRPEETTGPSESPDESDG
jgi:hypothetical protein